MRTVHGMIPSQIMMIFDALFFHASLLARQYISKYGVANDAERVTVFSCGQLSNGNLKKSKTSPYVRYGNVSTLKNP